MSRPSGLVPYEIFGHSTGEHVGPAINERFQAQRCPFLGRECTKSRKSDPKTKIGSCTLGYKGKGHAGYRPVIICPDRFVEPAVFKSIEELYFPGRDRVEWVKEVNLGGKGSIDYVAAIPGKGHRLDDFLCVEIQAGGTTGTPWDGINYFRKSHTLDGMPKLKYGINWANEFAKTLMQQIYKKGNLIDSWKRKMVIVIQDVGMEYILNQGDGIDEFDEESPIHFLSFELEYANDGKWHLSPKKERYSANMQGIMLALASGGGADITEREFMRSIIKKGERDGNLSW